MVSGGEVIMVGAVRGGGGRGKKTGRQERGEGRRERGEVGRREKGKGGEESSGMW